jgi:hypothetical protein
MWDRIPWEEEGRELDECVEDDETEVEREWRGRKSRGMLLRITCIVRSRRRVNGSGLERTAGSLVRKTKQVNTKRSTAEYE